MSNFWKIAFTLSTLCIIFHVAQSIKNGKLHGCPSPEFQMSPCKEMCETDDDCVSPMICCNGSCEKTTAHPRPDKQKIYYKACSYPDPCMMEVCKNGATCVRIGLTDYNCICAPGYDGTECEFEIDECMDDPCQNGATCTDLLDDYRCCCLPGYNGKNCSDVDLCPQTENLCAATQCKKYPHAKCFVKVYYQIIEDGRNKDVTEECLLP